jgi:hypothetical protein
MKIKIKLSNTRKAHLFSGDCVEFMSASRSYYLLPHSTRVKLQDYLERLKASRD